MLLTITPGECDMLFYAVVFNRNKSVESLTCLFLDVIIHLWFYHIDAHYTWLFDDNTFCILIVFVEILKSTSWNTNFLLKAHNIIPWTWRTLYKFKKTNIYIHVYI